MYSCFVTCHFKAKKIGKVSKVFYMKIVIKKICYLCNLVKIVAGVNNVINIDQTSICRMVRMFQK